MFRGGGGGGTGAAIGAQLFDMLRSLSALPSEELLRFVIGLLLIILIIILIRRSPPVPAPPARQSTTCLVCGQPLTDRVYVDRYIPNWVTCSRCYEQLSPYQQRQYRPR